MARMLTEEFKAAFPLSWQRFIEACKKDDISFEPKEVDAYFRRNGEIYKVCLRTEEEKRSICL